MQVGSATSLPAPVLQKQNRNKHSSTPRLLRMAVAWLSSATPALDSIHRWQSESPPAEASGSTEPTPFSGRAPGARLLGKLSPTADQRGVMLRTVSPSPGVRGEHGALCQLGHVEGWQGKHE